MVRRTKDEAEKTRDAILNAAERVFYVQGVSRTSLEQVAAAAGVTRGAIYWHFKDKMELCEAMMCRVFLPHEDMLEKLVAAPSTTPLKDLEKACLHAIHMMATDKHRRDVVTIFMQRCEYVEEMENVVERRNACKNRMLASSEKLFQQARRQKMLNKAWTPRGAAIAVQAMMTGLIMGAMEKRDNFDFVTTCPSCIKTFFKALRA